MEDDEISLSERRIRELNKCSSITKYYWSITVNLLGIVTYFVDVGLDITLAAWYYAEGLMMEFGWTLAFILIPMLVNTAVSMQMYSMDEKRDPTFSNQYTKPSWCRNLLLLISPVLRHLDIISFTRSAREAGLACKEERYDDYRGLTIRESTDAAFLRLLECLLETVPQQVLQLSFLLAHYDPVTGLTPRQQVTVGSMAFGVVLLAVSFTSYRLAVTFAHYGTVGANLSDTVLQTILHFLVTVSRVISLSMAAYLFPNCTMSAAIIHIIAMAAFLYLKPAPLFSHNKILSFCFSVVLGVAYLFTFILPSKNIMKYLIYSILCLVQNIICAVLWNKYAQDALRNSWCFQPFLILSILLYCVGILMAIAVFCTSNYVKGLPRLSTFNQGSFVVKAHMVKSEKDGRYRAHSTIYQNGMLQKRYTSTDNLGDALQLTLP